MQHATGDVLITQDADLELNPDEYGKLLAPIINDGCNDPSGGSAFKRPSASEGGDAFGLFLAGYAPGKGIDVFPMGMAKKVPAGSMLVFQMHYSSYGGKFEGQQGDRTRLGLHFTTKPPPTTTLCCPLDVGWTLSAGFPV